LAFPWDVAVFCFTAGAERFVSRLTREFLFSVVGEPNHKKKSKKSCPNLGPTLRFGSPPSGTAPGAGKTGHPWPVFAFRGSRPLNPLRSACTRPSLTGRADQQQDQDQDQKLEADVL
jgi:hypothetical protein